MACVRLQTPAPFSFRHPDEWPKWKRRFEQFRSASGLSSEEQERQVSTLLYTMGEEADDILTSTNITQEHRKIYDRVVAKFDAFFQVRKNVIFERARFNRRSQNNDESVEQFITNLYQLAENCAYGEMKEEMIRDRIVVGIRDTGLSQRLRLDATLTLETAKKMVRQREAVQEQQELMKAGFKPKLPVDAVRYKPKVNVKQSQSSTKKVNFNFKSNKCSRCGKGPHPKQQCPAKDVVCHSCKRKGHYRSQCFSKKAVDDVTTPQEPQDDVPESEYYDTAYLDVVDEPEGNSNSWRVIIKVNGQGVNFKIDTGAEVSVITERTMDSLKLNRKLSRETTKQLMGANKTQLEVICEFVACLEYNGRKAEQPIYVVKKLQNDLLGLPAIKALNLLAQIDSIQKSIPDQYPSLFEGLGTFKGEYRIELKSSAKPFALFTPRIVPLPLRDKVHAELTRMETLGVISKVEKPTSWCAAMVVVPKKSGSVRICVDFRPLNESVLREVHPIPKVDETLGQLAGAAVFSKLDANCGFWQIPLEEHSRDYTTFITPFGRFRFNKLPFGIASAPEHFQRRMNQMLAGLEGVLIHMDDVLVYGKSKQEHNQRLHAVLERIRERGATLNKDKCEFTKAKLHFLRHVIGSDGMSPDPAKTKAILEMEKPKTVTELRRFMGMANHLGKFSPNLSEYSQPLRELLTSKRVWMWGAAQDEAFIKIKGELTKPTVLSLYDLNAQTKIRADASAYGLGAVLLQYHPQQQHWKPVAYASKSLTETERRYSQIEKEALALVWSCEKFSDYIIGKKIEIETDHKPLVPLLSHTSLDRLPPRILRFRLRLTRFDYSISHVPGKCLYTADTLSRAPLPSADPVFEGDEDVENFVQAIIQQLPANKDRLEQYRKAQQDDSLCSQVIGYTKSKWPARHTVKGILSKYWAVRNELTVSDNLLLYRRRIVIPSCLQHETLEKIHHGHQGIQRCRLRVSNSVWWPGASKAVEEFVKLCPTCMKTTPPPVEPLLQPELPSHPWERVAADLLVVDYYSRYMEIQKLTSTSSASVIATLKAIFSRHGIPSEFVSDNGPQFDSREMKEFAASYNFTHTTSSPHYPQSNGLAERMVKTVKELIGNSPDPYMALLSYRATPLPWCGLSPAELLMGRCLRTDVPQVKKHFIPKWPHIKDFREKDEKHKSDMKYHYDKRHRVRETSPLPDNTDVWINTQGRENIPGQVIQRAEEPRSYLISTPSGEVQRTKSQIRVRAKTTSVPESELALPSSTTQTSRIATRSQTGTVLHPPDRYSNWVYTD